MDLCACACDAIIPPRLAFGLGWLAVAITEIVLSATAASDDPYHDYTYWTTCEAEGCWLLLGWFAGRWMFVSACIYVLLQVYHYFGGAPSCMSETHVPFLRFEGENW